MPDLVPLATRSNSERRFLSYPFRVRRFAVLSIFTGPFLSFTLSELFIARGSFALGLCLFFCILFSVAFLIVPVMMTLYTPSMGLIWN